MGKGLGRIRPARGTDAGKCSKGSAAGGVDPRPPGGKAWLRAPVSVPITDRPRQQMGKEQFPRHQLTNTKVVGKGKSPSPPLPCISLTPVRSPLQWIKSKSIAKFKNTFNADLFISRRVCTIDSFPLQKLFKPARFLFILLYLNI